MFSKREQRAQAKLQALTNACLLPYTRHVVHRHARMSPDALEAGYWQAYGDFSLVEPAPSMGAIIDAPT